MQLLPGSTRIFEHDDDLASADPVKSKSINPLGGFGQLCRALEDRYSLDYIIVDLAPSATALNKTVVMR